MRVRVRVGVGGEDPTPNPNPNPNQVSQWCRDGLGIPISNRVLADAMHLVEGWSCGGPLGPGLGLGLGVRLGFANPHPNPNSKPNPNQVLWRALPQGR